jgi:alkylation response protein AidB-like acyl-CoA dehydrogenase
MRKISDSQLEIIRKARVFAAQHVSEGEVQKWCREQGVPSSVMQAFLQSGLGLIGAPVACGGVPASMAEQLTLLEELTRLSATVLPFVLQTYNLALLDGLGESKQVKRILKAFLETGFPDFSIAVSEPQSGSDVFAMRTRVTEERSRLVLNGVKTYVSNGEYAANLMVIATDLPLSAAGDLYSVWMIPLHSPGVSTFPIRKIGWDAQPFCEVCFKDVEVRPQFLLGSRGLGRDILRSSFVLGRCNIAAVALGLARAAIADAVLFATHRQAFGHAITEYQMIDELLVDMETDVTNMESLLYGVAQSIDAGHVDHALISMMKRSVTNTAFRVADNAMKVFGGVGYTEQSRIGRIWRDARGCQIAEGTEQVMVRNAIRHVVRKHLSESI